MSIKSHQQTMPFADSLKAHMEAWSGLGKHSPTWDDWSDGIYSDYRDLVRQMLRANSVKLHPRAACLLSSQIFALNLFVPFRKGDKAHLSHYMSKMVGSQVTIEDVCFEWVPPGGLLGELRGERPTGNESATATDVVLWARLEDGRHSVVLIEIKLSERGFTPCKGRISSGNRRVDVCNSAKLFFDDPNACYLRRPQRKKRDRRYWEIFTQCYGSVRDAFPHADLNGPCPFAYDMQQPMRNLAIARGLEQENMVTKAWFALCAHDDNPDMGRHWEKWKDLLPVGSIAPYIPASKIVNIGEAAGLKDWAVYMRNRYRL